MRTHANLPVLDGLGGGGGPQFGHQDPHDVKEEDEVNLRVRADWGQCRGPQQTRLLSCEVWDLL